VGRQHESLRLGVGLTAAMFPFMPFICMTALMASCLNVLGRFGWPAAMPIVMNLIQIACIWWVAPNLPGGQERQVYALAAAVVISGAAQAMILGAQLRRLGFVWRLLWLPRHPGVRRMFATMAPAMLGLGVLQIEPVIDGQIILWLSAAGEQKTNFAGFINTTGALSANWVGQIAPDDRTKMLKSVDDVQKAINDGLENQGWPEETVKKAKAIIVSYTEC
jgi:hypothetical protein